jgi:hypothetical protein
MSVAAIVAWVMLALLIGWLGIVLAATFRQMDSELEEDARRRNR